MATTKTLIDEARTFGGGWVGDVRSALSRRVNAMVAAQRRYSPAELASPSDWDPDRAGTSDLDDRLALDDVDDLDDDPYGSAAWWERD